MGVDCGRQTSGVRGVGSMFTNGGGGGGQKLVRKILRTSFMYDPLLKATGRVASENPVSSPSSAC